MKTYSKLLGLSFIPYLFYYRAIPYVTAQTWANIAFYIFLACVLYQLCYLFFLRKKENNKFLNALGTIFFYFSLTLVISIVYFFINIYINGYRQSEFLHTGFTCYYGLEAWKNAAWETFVFVPVLTLCFIYDVCFLLIKKRKIK